MPKKAAPNPTPAPLTEVGFDNAIFIKGARTHNLKNVDVSIPRNQLVVVTGVSGSGKSSLTIDTLFAEGQRRYAESLSAYARQFMQRMNKPEVDYIKGLCPAIAIEQKVITRTPRSTVGSMTEMYDYLRLLYARIGTTISPISGRAVKKDDTSDVVAAMAAQSPGAKMLLLVAFKVHQNRNPKEELNILLQKGFTRVAAGSAANKEMVTHRIEDLMDDADLYESVFGGGATQQKAKLKPDAQCYLVVDRLVAKAFDDDDLHRLGDSVDTAFFEGEGSCLLLINDDKALSFSNRFELDGMQFDEPVPNLFSFNNPYGACPTCEGFGQVLGIDPNLVIPDRSLSVYENAIAPWRGEKLGEWNRMLIRAAPKFGFPIHKPIHDLTEDQYRLLWKGNAHFEGLDAFFNEVEQNLYKVQYRVLLSRYRGRTTCPECEGYRLRKSALYVKIADQHIGQLCAMPIDKLHTWLQKLTLSPHEATIAKRILIELDLRLQTMRDVGLGYLTLNRLANSLSGGESQRIQLTRSLGSNLTNSLYILDEPSIGLHSRDTERLIQVLKNLRNLQNTVVVVEHDDMMMRQADYIIDMGPLASHQGGQVVAAGNYKQLIANPESLTGQYLSGKMRIEPPPQVRSWKQSIWVRGARQNNLKNIDVQLPLGCLLVISGVSGSGKTTLIKQIAYPALQKAMGEPTDKVGQHQKLEGDYKQLTGVELIDQNPIGKSSRSNPVTYIKAYDAIRDLYANQQLSKIRDFQPRHFSFNVDGGRCDTCKGEGEQVVEMQFLADVHLVCESCGGKRFKDEVLEVRCSGKNIHDLLEMSVDEALAFFTALGKEGAAIATAIKPLQDVGLGYVKLGQSSDTLSGGEAQRVKLASFLGKGKSAGQLLFIFDEPTTGLHFHDIKKLLASFNALIAQGHSIWVIEHNTDVINSADWVIDLGPEAGEAGGNLVFSGTPAQLKGCAQSWTGKFL
ncbi:MAG: excinuclease ABC subunit A [Bacteroidetes bacterium]|nr:MAG: excinuclease ABC subunit A [Bacteroidota bacterium]